jgi:hypothetical protein
MYEVLTGVVLVMRVVMGIIKIENIFSLMVQTIHKDPVI